MVVVVVVVVAVVVVVGGSGVLPQPVTFQGQSQTLSSGLNAVPSGQSSSYRNPFEH